MCAWMVLLCSRCCRAACRKVFWHCTESFNCCPVPDFRDFNALTRWPNASSAWLFPLSTVPKLGEAFSASVGSVCSEPSWLSRWLLPRRRRPWAQRAQRDGPEMGGRSVRKYSSRQMPRRRPSTWIFVLGSRCSMSLGFGFFSFGEGVLEGCDQTHPRLTCEFAHPASCPGESAAARLLPKLSALQHLLQLLKPFQHL